jgi:Cys-tRNA(Pro)/Cys-tRNA(Cys) deacylase
MAKGGTPAIVQLEAAGVQFRVHEFAHDGSMRGFGLAAAAALGVEPDRVFKTLLADVIEVGGAASHVVGIVPVAAQLSLRDLAVAVGAKRTEMCEPRAAERISGYVVGGISPFGQKRPLRTVIDETCVLADTLFVSGGRRGIDIEIAPDDLVAVLGAIVAPIAAW